MAANSRGRYTHQSDQYDAPLDPNFEGYAQFATDADGRYRIKTIKPGRRTFAANRGRLIVDLNVVPDDAEKALSASWDIVLHDG
jgi:protocatechuate 3,4-dioxygenase beta subunit